jgi:hypothetical protein
MRWLWTLAFGLTLLSPYVADAATEKRVALVIGNGAYVQVPHLPNPPHDAEDVAAALRRLGFETVVATDLTQAGMQEAENAFSRAARTADVALFYYSGHAMQVAGVNYLVPIDAQLRDEPDLQHLARADQIVADLQQAKTLRILVLDSCRDNPLAEVRKRSVVQSRGVSLGGLAKMASADGTIITYSTQAGHTAVDGTGRNSPFTSAFLSHIEDKEDVAKVFHLIGASVYNVTKGSQVPELSISFFGEFYLNGKPQVATIQTPLPTPVQVDPCVAAYEQWKRTQTTGGPAAMREFVARNPSCPPFVGLPKSKAVPLSAPVADSAMDPPTLNSSVLNSSTLDSQRFDGTWFASRTCPALESGGLDDKFQFIGAAKDGVFHGQYGAVGTPESETFDGKIKPDGSAVISIKVLGETETSQADPFTSFVATARFQEARGQGLYASMGRICNFEFVKLDEPGSRSN